MLSPESNLYFNLTEERKFFKSVVFPVCRRQKIISILTSKRFFCDNKKSNRKVYLDYLLEITEEAESLRGFIHDYYRIYQRSSLP